ncbi:sugar ABC transporter [Enterovibrio norvegicus FF-33]|uniref:Autoinducer 2-binding periplasmic protein LuxP n=1 Tax=Enterovibrio norvegicus FF-454 TaxID=1185651 RepID=A0A1E5CA24_9GAMM|nr:sugar ABC transporter substrate-binding protein [Enterovibrio norvegicus]OEE62267.1 sugar ABC transporter [Enterovibrio norvegicus FF-454]OEE65919.1 sugar ABC transporter [Enterovibrio norvegicus FF-33]OEE74353.1 sugar ABC transporter [Enterovibrio norvegicus FF-162]
MNSLLRKSLLKKSLLAAMIASLPMAQATAEEVLIGLITKTNTNPFFVKMKEGAQEKATELGAKVSSFAGRFDGDTDSQVQAIENLVAAGAKGILITPSDPQALAPSVKRAQDAGVLVIALDTPFTPPNVADATFATDNFKAGELIGEWAKAQMGDEAKNAKIALLDLSTANISVDVARNQGFLTGFGIDTKNPNINRDEDDPRIVGNDVTQGSEEGGRRAMENLLQKDPSINLVYTINEPAAAGAYEALKALGRQDDVMIVSVDGGCPGVDNVEAGVIGATSMQFPLQMAALGVEAVVEYAKSGVKPGATPGKAFFDTGVELITDEPATGVASSTSKQGKTKCWG